MCGIGREEEKWNNGRMIVSFYSGNWNLVFLGNVVKRMVVIYLFIVRIGWGIYLLVFGNIGWE